MDKFITIAWLSPYVGRLDYPPNTYKRKWFIFRVSKNTGLVYIGVYRIRIAFNWRENIARILHRFGKKPTYTTDVTEHLHGGYGKCGQNGFWQFPLPDNIKEKYDA